MTTSASAGFSANALRILKTRYFLKNEKGELVDKTPADLFLRVARAVAAAERTARDREIWAKRFFDLMMARDFLPNSPTLTGAGRDMCLSACFVLPIEDSMESIFDTVKNAALVHKEGGGTGFDFSRLRSKGSFVQKTQGVASGPVSFLKVIDAATEAVKQGGTRRGANMGILRVDHPDIEEFILMKKDGKSVGNFNISVAATDAFMEAVRKGTSYEIVDPRKKKAVDRKDARKIFRMIVESAWAIGDPGLLFIDRINASNPTRALGPISATNPCGEQPLHPYESCNLGSINLANFFDPARPDGFDWDRFAGVVAAAVRFLDDVIDVNKYPLPQIEAMSKGNRRIGLGIMGWADLLLLKGIRYDAPEALALAGKIGAFLRAKAVAESARLAQDAREFPEYREIRVQRPADAECDGLYHRPDRDHLPDRRLLLEHRARVSRSSSPPGSWTPSSRTFIRSLPHGRRRIRESRSPPFSSRPTTSPRRGISGRRRRSRSRSTIPSPRPSTCLTPRPSRMSRRPICSRMTWERRASRSTATAAARSRSW